MTSKNSRPRMAGVADGPDQPGDRLHRGADQHRVLDRVPGVGNPARGQALVVVERVDVGVAVGLELLEVDVPVTAAAGGLVEEAERAAEQAGRDQRGGGAGDQGQPAAPGRRGRRPRLRPGARESGLSPRGLTLRHLLPLRSVPQRSCHCHRAGTATEQPSGQPTAVTTAGGALPGRIRAAWPARHRRRAALLASPGPPGRVPSRLRATRLSPGAPSGLALPGPWATLAPAGPPAAGPRGQHRHRQPGRHDATGRHAADGSRATRAAAATTAASHRHRHRRRPGHGIGLPGRQMTGGWFWFRHRKGLPLPLLHCWGWGWAWAWAAAGPGSRRCRSWPGGRATTGPAGC